MTTSRIYDLQRSNVLAVDLRHVLKALGPRTAKAFWQASEVTSFSEPLFATGKKADELELLSVSTDRIDGAALHDLAENVTQVIWGEFRAYDELADMKPWVIVRAIDSTFYEVISSDPAVHDALKRAFRDVRPA